MKINAKSIVILTVLTCLTVCLCGCGEGGSTEETVAITTVSEKEAEDAKQAEDMSVYESIYTEYNEKMKESTETYAKELKSKADEVDKDKLYDLVTEKTDAIDKIRQEGADKMTDETLDSTDDDQKEYEKWFSKLSEKSTEYTRKLTSIYTDRF